MTKPKGFLQAIADEFGEDVVVGRDKEVRGWLDTGNYALNRIISGDYLKGYPYGKIVELYGEPMTGKSTLINVAMARHLEKHGEHAACVLDDTEDSFSESIARMNGLDPNRLIRRVSSTVEEHFGEMFGIKTIARAVKDKERGKELAGLLPFILENDPEAKILLALDSLGQLSSEHEKATGFVKDDMSKAKKIKAGVRMSCPFIYKNDVLYMVANHVYDVINVPFSLKATPGGKAIPFLSSVRIELVRREKIKKGDQVVAILAEAKITKNKIYPPFRHAKIKIHFETGVDRMSGLADLLVDDGIIDKKVAGYLYFGESKVAEKDFTEEMFLNLLADKKKKD